MIIDHVVEVRFPGISLGSGYRLSDRHVLTAKHVLPTASTGEPCEITPLSSQMRHESFAESKPIPGKVGWVSQDHDLAIIEINPKHKAASSFADDRRNTEFLELPVSAARWACTAVGFPQASGRADKIIHAHLTWVSRGNRFDIDVGVNVPRNLDFWAGYSGAAVCIDSKIAGVIRTVNRDWSNQLSATPISLLLDDKQFQTYWKHEGESLPIRNSFDLRTDLLSLTVRANNQKLQAFAKPNLLDNCLKAQNLTDFPGETLNVYPIAKDDGLIWGSTDVGASLLHVNSRAYTQYQATVTEGAALWDRVDEYGSSSRGPLRPAISALRIIQAIAGLFKFWRQICQKEQADGAFNLRLQNLQHRFLSFEGIDKKLNLRYPAPCDYSFWNHDSSEICQELIEISHPFDGELTNEKIVQAVTTIFCDLAFYFNFSVRDYSSHSMKKIRDIVQELA